MQGYGQAGWLLAHEVGHTYGLVDPSQPNHNGAVTITGEKAKKSHSINGRIFDPTAFNLGLGSLHLQRKSIPIPSSVMGANDLDENELFETIDWNWLRDGLKLTSPIIMPPVDAVFYIVGTINRDDTVERLDSRFWPPGVPTDPPVDSPFTIVFLNENGQVLASSGFSVSFEGAHVDPDGVPEEPHTGAPFSVAQPFPIGAVEVQLRHGGKVIASLRPSVNPPSIALLTPGDGEVFKRSQPGMLIQWSGSDLDGDPLTYTLSFSSDGGQTFLPIGTAFGPETTSYVWNTSFSPRNTKQGVIRVEASDGFNVKTTSSTVFEVASVACDIDGNGNIDRNDINAIFAARNTQSTADDLRDVDSNGAITVNDARICTLRCTKPRCAP
jgi:hypothetical protein